ncbi:sensor histidine kinase [Halobacteriales archaeon Cl-PHB]
MGGNSTLRRTIDSIRHSYVLKFALTLAVVFVALLLLGTGIFLQSSGTVESHVEETVTTQATLEAEELQSWLDANERPVRLASADSVFRSGSEAEIQRHLETVRDDRLAEATFELHYLNYRDGTAVASTDEEVRGQTLSDRPWYASLRFQDIDDVYVSAPYTTDDGRSVMAFVSPVNEVPERHLVLVVPTANREAGGQPFEGSFTTVVDSQGQVIFPANASQPVQPYLADENRTSTAVRLGVQGERGFLETHEKNDELDQDVVVGYAPVDGSDWTVIHHVPTSVAYQTRTTVQMAAVLLLGAGLFGLLLFGLTVGRRTVRDIRDLSQRAAAIEDGDYELSLETGRTDELGSLYESIDGMRDELVDQIDDARAARRTAEQNTEQLRVVDRLLRHNLRNKLNIIQLSAQAVEQSVPEDEVEETELILETCDDILAKVDKQRLFTAALATGTEAILLDISTEIRSVCQDLAAEYPAATIDCDVPDGIEAHGLPSFTEAVRELIRNGIQHNDQAQPVVTIRVRDHAETVEFRIDDNGPGLPKAERKIIADEHETGQLRHSSGVGLWMVRWVVQQSGGTVSFTDSEPTGTVVRIDLTKSDTGSGPREDGSHPTE